MAKIGEGHLGAMGRLGLKEFTHLTLPAFPQGQHIIEEPGLFGNPTQGEVASARDGPGSGHDQESKLSMSDLRGYAEARTQEANKEMENGKQNEGNEGMER